MTIHNWKDMHILATLLIVSNYDYFQMKDMHILVLLVIDANYD